jgi:ribosomal protein L44E
MKMSVICPRCKSSDNLREEASNNDTVRAIMRGAGGISGQKMVPKKITYYCEKCQRSFDVYV